MPAIIDYSQVLDRMTAGGFCCNYPNSGAFGFSRAAQIEIRGWIGPADVSIKPSLMPMVKTIPPPYEANLAEAAARVWREALPGSVWIMPASHWHFEFHDGSRDWLPGVFGEIGVDPALLRDRADGSALEFSMEEMTLFMRLTAALLENLKVSDFTLVFPGRTALCCVHHHKQLWWTTTDAEITAQIDGLFTQPAR